MMIKKIGEVFSKLKSVRKKTSPLKIGETGDFPDSQSGQTGEHTGRHFDTCSVDNSGKHSENTHTENSGEDSGENVSESTGEHLSDDFNEYARKIHTRRTAIILSIPALILIVAIASYYAFGYIPAAGGGFMQSAVRLNEIMPSSSACPNDDGIFCDYIELYNDSDHEADISGFQLSDNELTSGLLFGNHTVIPAHGYLVVSCTSEGNGHGGNAVYAPFSISRDGGEKVILKNSLGITIDSVVTTELSKSEAMVRTGNGQWEHFSLGTPGFENNTAGRAAYIESLHKDNGLVITELMAKNISGPAANNGERYDWVELTNFSDTVIDLDGYHLSDDPSSLAGYALPTRELLPNECVLLFASNLTNSRDGEIHTDFSLSSDGETLFLTSPGGKLVSLVEYPPIPDNNTFMLKDGVYAVSAFSSPGSTDTEPAENAYEGLIISELMPVNTASIMDSNGNFSDWLELANNSSKEINLAGCWLSIDPSNPFGWQFPDVTIISGEYLLAFASGKKTDGSGEPHVDFKLPSSSGTLTLVSPNGYVIDSVSYTSPQSDRSLIRTSSGLENTPFSTPRFSNGTDGYTAYQESLAVVSPLILSEAMTTNDIVLPQAYGRYFDWIEIKNAGETPIQLSDYYLSDDIDNKAMWRLPELTLEPGSYKVFICSGDEALTTSRYTHTNFSLNAETETLFIFDQEGRWIDRLLLCDIPANVSAGRMDGQNGLFLFADPTPGTQNTGGVRAVSEAPYSTTAAGVYETDSIAVPLYADGDIYYTTDGSRPDERSKKYTAPIAITESTVIRAVAYNAGSMQSSTTTLSFFFE